jgi:hypothetical protein
MREFFDKITIQGFSLHVADLFTSYKRDHEDKYKEYDVKTVTKGLSSIKKLSMQFYEQLLYCDDNCINSFIEINTEVKIIGTFLYLAFYDGIIFINFE